MKPTNSILFLLLFIPFISLGQSYSLTFSSEEYQFLSGSTSLNDTLTWDDPQFTIPIGFEFLYFDTTITEIYLSYWGLGGELTTDTSETGVYALLLAYGADIIDRGWDFNLDEPSGGSLSTISYKTEGTVGQRICKIEWRNVGFYDELDQTGFSIDYANFQLWLHEGSNNIELHFGPSSISSPDLCYGGETGTYIGFYPAYDFDTEDVLERGYVVHGDSSNPTITYTFAIYEDYINGIIDSGTVYKLTYDMASLLPLPVRMGLEIYPNPASDMLYLQYAPSFGVSKIEISNVQGKMEIQTDAVQSIDISDLNPGLYFIQIHTAYGVVSKQIVIL